MKNKGVLLTILLILVLGAGITVKIHQFVTENTDSVTVAEMTGEVSEQAGTGAPDSTLSQAAASNLMFGIENNGIATAGARSIPETAQENTVSAETDAIRPEYEEEALLEDSDSGAMEESNIAMAEAAKEEPKAVEQASVPEDIPEETVMSPLSAAPVGVAPEEEPDAEDYRKKLEEVDRIIKEMRENDTSTNTDSAKKAAEYEYRLWDSELNRIYQAIISSMEEGEAEKLRGEERTWIRDRDQTARQAAARCRGGTMESLEYTASLSVSTRGRAYELLETYGELLGE